MYLIHKRAKRNTKGLNNCLPSNYENTVIYTSFKKCWIIQHIEDSLNTKAADTSFLK